MGLCPTTAATAAAGGADLVFQLLDSRRLDGSGGAGGSGKLGVGLSKGAWDTTGLGGATGANGVGGAGVFQYGPPGDGGLGGTGTSLFTATTPDGNGLGGTTGPGSAWLSALATGVGAATCFCSSAWGSSGGSM